MIMGAAIGWGGAIILVSIAIGWLINRRISLPAIAQFTAIAELMLKCASLVALLLGGGWALYKFVLEGADDWVNNISVQTQVLPYRNDLRMLVVHVKSKNPRNAKFELDPVDGIFEIEVRSIPENLDAKSVIHETEGTLLAKVDLMPKDGWELLPYGEFDDIATFILPKGTIAAITATMRKKNGATTAQGIPDYDDVSASAVIRVELDEDNALKHPSATAHTARNESHRSPATH